jgi:hypothetical protein
MTATIDRWQGQPWAGPEVIAAGMIFGLNAATMVTRDFGLTLLSILYLFPFLLVSMAAVMLWRSFHGRGKRSIPLALVILVLTWPLGRSIQSIWDWSGVVAWSLSHRQEVAVAAGQDKVIAVWADWGWAGGSTFAYVVSDAQDDSASDAGAERWRKRLNLDCPVAYGQRIWRGLYLIETSDCPFGGNPIPLA